MRISDTRTPSQNRRW